MVVGCVLVYIAVILLGVDHGTLVSDDHFPVVCSVSIQFFSHLNLSALKYFSLKVSYFLSIAGKTFKTIDKIEKSSHFSESFT